jgi:hypoxanthine phosphoribosyltransferase
VKPVLRVQYSPRQIAARITQMGRQISRDFGDKRVDVVTILDNAFIFSADLVRAISCPVICHFVQAQVREVHVNGRERREVFFSYNPELGGRDVVVVDAVLHSGVTLEFLVRRLAECRPRSLRVAVLLDKEQERRVDLRPDYLGFSAASKYLVGYGLPDAEGLCRNLPYIAAVEDGGARREKRSARTRRGTSKRRRAR